MRNVSRNSNDLLRTDEDVRVLVEERRQSRIEFCRHRKRVFVFAKASKVLSLNVFKKTSLFAGFSSVSSVGVSFSIQLNVKESQSRGQIRSPELRESHKFSSAENRFTVKFVSSEFVRQRAFCL